MIPFLHVWRLTIPTFGLMVATAMVAAFFVLRADLARREIAAKDSGFAEALIAIPCLAGIIGAKLYHVLEDPRLLMSDPRELISQYGFAWFGGLIAGMAAFIWLARRHKIPLLNLLDAGSAAAALGYGIGRIGCLLSGDGDYGIPTSLPWGMSFPHGLVPTTQRVHPTPIYEFLVACLIAWMLWKLGSRQMHSLGVASELPERGTPAAPNFLPDGSVFAFYLVLTGVARFLVEFIRINPRSFLGLTNAQAASLASIAAGLILWIVLARRRQGRESLQGAPVRRTAQRPANQRPLRPIHKKQ
jgi:phosphatidylglycerol---prolipoprotein diacylglyceryl transferase